MNGVFSEVGAGCNSASAGRVTGGCRAARIHGLDTRHIAMKIQMDEDINHES